MAFRIGTAVLALLIVTAAATIPYSSALRGPFLYDDLPNIKENSHLQITQLDLESLKAAAFSSPLPSRFLSYLTFALNYYFHGHDTFGYHLVNVIIHALNSLLVLLIAQVILRDMARSDITKTSIWIGAVASASIFAAHPIQVQTVAYIVQRMTSLATLFFLLSFALYIFATKLSNARKKWVAFGLSALCWVAALGNKEIAITLPVVIVLHRWLIYERGDLTAFRSYLPQITIGLVLVICVSGIFLAISGVNTLSEMYIGRFFTPKERLLTECRVVIHYMTLILAPLPERLNVLHTYALSRSLIEPISTLFCLLTILSIVGSAFYFAKRSPFLSFCALWFFLNLLLESSILALDLAYEHRLYLPSVGVFWAVGYLVMIAASKRVGSTVVPVAIVVTLLAIGSHVRSEVWTDGLLMWRDVVHKSPDNPTALNNYASALKRVGEIEKSLPLVERALEVNPHQPKTYINYATTLYMLGRHDEAKLQVAEMQRRFGSHASSLQVLGEIAESEGDRAAAIAYFKAALSLDPDVFSAHARLGLIYFQMFDVNIAVRHFREALRLNAGDDQVRYLLARSYALQGRHKRAVREFQKLSVTRGDSNILYYFALSLLALGDGENAQRLLLEILGRNDASYVSAAVALGDYQLSIGRIAAAVDTYEKAASRKGGNADIRAKLIQARARMH